MAIVDVLVDGGVLGTVDADLGRVGPSDGCQVSRAVKINDSQDGNPLLLMYNSAPPAADGPGEGALVSAEAPRGEIVEVPDRERASQEAMAPPPLPGPDNPEAKI